MLYRLARKGFQGFGIPNGPILPNAAPTVAGSVTWTPGIAARAVTISCQSL